MTTPTPDPRPRASIVRALGFRGTVLQTAVFEATLFRAALFVVLGLHAAWVAALAMGHEPWRDEWQAWAIARASATPGELLANLAYEGHPPLWHALLWGPAQLGLGPGAMQGLAGLAAVAAAALVLFRAPFPFWARVMVVFTYPFAFEWAVVARGYGVGLALALAACALWPTRYARPWALFGVVALLPLTSAYGAIVAFAFLVALSADDRATGAWRKAARQRPDALGLAGSLPLIGFLAAVWVAKPPADFVPGAGQHAFPLDVLVPGALARIGWGLFPLPGNLAYPWSSAALGAGAPAIAAGLAGLAAWWWLGPRGKPVATAFFVAGSAGLLAMSLGLHLGVLRHALHYEVVVLCALWLAALEPGRPPAAFVGAGRVVLAALLAPAVAASAWLGLADATRPFSNGPAMAAWLRAHPDPAATLVATPDAAAISVAAALDQPIFTLEGGGPRRFVRWNRDRFLTDSQRATRLQAIAQQGPIRLLTNRPTPAAGTLLHAEVGALVDDEDFWLYERRP